MNNPESNQAAIELFRSSFLTDPWAMQGLKMEAALKAVLLVFQPGWSDKMQQEWQDLQRAAGRENIEDFPNVPTMCQLVREVLGISKERTGVTKRSGKKQPRMPKEAINAKHSRMGG